MNWFSACLDLIYPPQCPVCAQPHDVSRQEPICPDCAARWPYPPAAWCQRCGRALPRTDYQRCWPCQQLPSTYDRLFLASRYEDPTRQLVHLIKFRQRQRLCRYLAQRAAERWIGQMRGLSYDALVPVPLHARRLAHRGFNQSALLAHALARELRAPCEARLLVKRRHSKPQSLRSRRARWSHAASAFALRPRAAAPCRTLLVDDVLTTGATAQACAGLLRRAGAAHVDVAVVATGGLA